MIKIFPSEDPWIVLKKFTAARIALGRTGSSLTTEKILALNEAHAKARDSIYEPLDKIKLVEYFNEENRDVLELCSKTKDKKEFLLRPDWGKQLNDESRLKLNDNTPSSAFDICINISNGLSATAVNLYAIPLLKILFKKIDEAGLKIAPVCIVENGRVAVSDETGILLNSKLSIILIGERPGLTASDSMSAYLTYQPQIGNTDAQRNCVSNIREGGLSYDDAATEIFSLITFSMQKKLSGPLLKSAKSVSGNQ